MRKVYRRLKWAGIDFLLGIHSNIPVCCVMYFLWVGVKHPTKVALEVSRHRRTLTDANYAQCPRCYAKGRVVEVHLCTRGCWWTRWVSDAPAKYNTKLRSYGT